MTSKMQLSDDIKADNQIKHTDFTTFIACISFFLMIMETHTQQ